MIDDPVGRAAPLNMAIDEALLGEASQPVLRFYRWSEPSVSFGYFGPFEEAKRFAGERAAVRRWTGGGIVPHGEDLTYSLVIPVSDAVSKTPPREIYRRVHEAIAAALRMAGIESALAALNAPKITDSCFANPVIADVMESGRKIAGAAQRRTRAGLLQQGSIQRSDLDQRFRQNFVRGLSNRVQEKELPSSVLREAEELAVQKYATEAWLRRRRRVQL